MHKYVSIPPPRCGLEGHVLNFQAKMVTSSPVDRDRTFIISFYLGDDSISVFECLKKNSGKNCLDKKRSKTRDMIFGSHGKR